MTLPKAFGLVLKELRNQVGISQEQLGLSCGLDRTFISQLERGIKQPSLATLVTLSVQLRIEAPELVRLTLERMNEN